MSTETTAGPQSISGTAWLVWGVGVLAYTVAVLQRTSLSVAGITAADRFGASASILATFAVLQLLVYAGLQIPVGVMVDRFGARLLIVTGGVVMAIGQTLLAFSTSVSGAVVARVLVGGGDAMTFVCVLRLVASWFPPRRNPLMAQLTGLVGQVGQILSAIPLVRLLHGPGWTATYLLAASMSVLVLVVAALVLRNEPPGVHTDHVSPSIRDVGRQLAEAFRHPGTRLGLWTHFTTQYSGTAFALLWGYPFLVSGEGLTPRAAGVLLTVFVLAGMAVGPVFGQLVGRHPLRRSWLVLGIIAVAVVIWTAVLAWPGRAPLWLLVLLVLGLALGGPGAMIGFDFARTFNPPGRIGSATGIVNIGGFVAGLLLMFAIGVVLDAVSGGGARDSYGLGAFKLAWSVQYVIWAFGVIGILRTRRLVRARMAEAGVVVPPMREAIARERRARRRR